MEAPKAEGGIHTNNPSAIDQYFKYYSKLANQQNMLQDIVRTGHYYDAITKNAYPYGLYRICVEKTSRIRS